MNNIIPIELYYPLYINICLFVVLFTLLHTALIEIDSSKNIYFINAIGILIFLFILFHIGLRPIHYTMGDTYAYNNIYTKYFNGGKIGNVNDYGWHLFMKTMSSICNIHVFFTVCAFLYTYPLYKISVKLFNEYWWYSFLMFIVSFSFWTYGINGVRNGVACSMFLWGVCYSDKKWIMALLFFIAASFHKTITLPIVAFIITYYYNNTQFYLKFWLACIPISLILGGFFITIFSLLGFGGDENRLTSYLSTNSSSFRWDFLFHSAFAVFAGWYFIIKKEFKDQTYQQLLNTYLICNSFWILVIRANYSNRFAYLSWFMMAIVIIYPFLKKVFFKDQHLVIGKVTLAYFSFTYAMYYLYY